jgi:hypothetical protein
VHRRSLPIHGPFGVNSAELKATGTATGTSATPIPAVEEKDTHVLHFTIKGSHGKDNEGHPVDQTQSASHNYTPDPGWVIDKSSGNGGYSIVVNEKIGIVEGPKVAIQGNTLTISGETKSWGALDVTVTVYLKSTGKVVNNKSSQSPRANVSFIDVAGLGGIDPGIAVGTDYILLCDDHTGVAVYDKSGKLLGSKSGESAFANPFTMSSLFNKVKADIDPQLNYPPGLPPGYSVAAGNGIRFYGDIRVMFDSYRKRFWISAVAANATPWNPRSKDGSVHPDVAQLINYPALKLVRRNKAAVAVSKTEDPRDGFYTYWWNETINNGDSNVPTGGPDPDFKGSGEGADYPSIGISPNYFVATIGVNRRDPSFKTDTPQLAQAWMDCKSSFEQDGHTFNLCGPFYIHIMVVDANALAAGNLFPHKVPKGETSSNPSQGWSFGLFVDAKNYLTDRLENGGFASDMARGVRAVVMHGPTVKTGTENPTTAQSADAYFVNHFIKRDGKEPESYLVLWSLVGNNLIPTLYRIGSFSFENWWQVVLNASYRDGNLYATFGHCWPPFANDCSPCIRVIRVDTLNSQVNRDRTFGQNNVDDNPSARFAYEFPGIQVNKHGDIVVAYTRYTFRTFLLKQEVRFNVWYHNEPDVRPSRLLKAGEALYWLNPNNNKKEVYATGTDTSGIAVDPSDDEAIWIAHIFAAKNNAGYAYRKIAFGKIFGNP